MAFQPNMDEIKAMFPEPKAAEKEAKAASMLDIKDEDLIALEAYINDLMSSFRFTGFNPEQFRHYLLHNVFVAPKFTKSQASAAISAIITLFVTRGNKISKKNEGRMPKAGQDMIKALEEKLNPKFKTKYDANELDDTTITPARVSATFPVTTVNVIQKLSTRIVGKAPVGLPKGLTTSFAFSVVPPQCENLLDAMGIWRDSFTLVINPKARSAEAQFLAQASAYNFSRLALDSPFVPDNVRIGTVVNLAMHQLSLEPNPVGKFLVLYWVDLPEFVEKITATMRSKTPVEEAQKYLIDTGFRATFVRSLPGATRSCFHDLVASFVDSFTDVDISFVNSEVAKRPVEKRFPIDEVTRVGTLGGRDQGRTFELEAAKMFTTPNQPGLSTAPVTMITPIAAPIPAQVPMPSLKFLRGAGR